MNARAELELDGVLVQLGRSRDGIITVWIETY